MPSGKTVSVCVKLLAVYESPHFPTSLKIHHIFKNTYLPFLNYKWNILCSSVLLSIARELSCPFIGFFKLLFVPEFMWPFCLGLYRLLNVLHGKNMNKYWDVSICHISRIFFPFVIWPFYGIWDTETYNLWIWFCNFFPWHVYLRILSPLQDEEALLHFSCLMVLFLHLNF